jgi:hypothetical protein
MNTDELGLMKLGAVAKSTITLRVMAQTMALQTLSGPSSDFLRTRQTSATRHTDEGLPSPDFREADEHA